MANIPRFQAKTINLGLFYGMGKNKLQAELGVNKEKAEEIFSQYHTKVPFVKTIDVRRYATCPEQWKNKDVTRSIVQVSFMGTKSVRDS